MKTLFDKIWSAHLIAENKFGKDLIYIDRHLIHEVTSPQAFESLNSSNRHVWRPSAHVGVADHNVPTINRSNVLDSSESFHQVKTLEKNCKQHKIKYFNLDSKYHGIVHVIGPELGITQPGMIIVCGDSHTSTHGAFGAIGFGIGTSEIEQVLATQTLFLKKPQNMLIKLNGYLSNELISAKDIALYILSQIGPSGAAEYALEYQGEIISSLSMEGRMTLCNMGIEAGARFCLIAPDEKTINYIFDKPYAPKNENFEDAIKSWKTLYSDSEDLFDRTLDVNITDLDPYVTWGTNLGTAISINDKIPSVNEINKMSNPDQVLKMLDYIGLSPGSYIKDTQIDTVFIGSCTNSRIEDLRIAAKVLEGKKIARHVRALIVPGSTSVKKQAEREGLDKIFIEAGCSWRDSGCSMCIGMNEDRLSNKERCASTSNRNFEGRQGRGGRTHLMSPAMAAAAAVFGRIVDVREVI